MKKNILLNLQPYLLVCLFFVAAVFFYIQFCLLPTEDRITPSAFASTAELFQDKDKHVARGQIIEHGLRDKKEIALTFDADMTYGMQHSLQLGEVATYADRRIIDHLIQNNIKATVFLAGMWIETYPEETKMMAASPLFELANHSYSHPSFAVECYGLAQISPSEYAIEIEKTQQLLKEITGTDNKYFRFPGGCYDQKVLDLVTKEGMITVHWDTVAHDGFSTDTEQIVANVLTNVQNGSIIVMHLGGESNTPKTYEALQLITTELEKKGFKFVTVSELLTPKTAMDFNRLSQLVMPNLFRHLKDPKLSS